MQLAYAAVATDAVAAIAAIAKPTAAAAATAALLRVAIRAVLKIAEMSPRYRSAAIRAVIDVAHVKRHHARIDQFKRAGATTTAASR